MDLRLQSDLSGKWRVDGIDLLINMLINNLFSRDLFALAVVNGFLGNTCENFKSD